MEAASRDIPFLFPTPLVVVGAYEIHHPWGAYFLDGHHLWDRMGVWIGCYKTATRAHAEVRSLLSDHYRKG